MDFDLRQLEIFCQVVEQRSFTRAAARVHLSQAAVSERVAGLEQAVGARLLDRLAREVVPTAAGRLLHQRALALLQARDSLRFELSELQGASRGTLTLAASTIPGEYILPGLLAAFRRRFPAVVVRLVGGDSAAVIRLVEQGRVEAGFVGVEALPAGLVATPLWEDELKLALPAGHRWWRRRSVPLGELMDEPLILRSQGSGTRDALERFLGAHGRGLDDLNVAAEVGSTGAVKQGILAGLGLSILSIRALRTELEVGLVRVLGLREGPLRRRFQLVHDPRRERSPLCDRFLEALDDPAPAPGSPSAAPKRAG